jgi:hypothetical protein
MAAVKWAILAVFRQGNKMVLGGMRKMSLE